MIMQEIDTIEDGQFIKSFFIDLIEVGAAVLERVGAGAQVEDDGEAASIGVLPEPGDGSIAGEAGGGVETFGRKGLTAAAAVEAGGDEQADTGFFCDGRELGLTHGAVDAGREIEKLGGGGVRGVGWMEFDGVASPGNEVAEGRNELDDAGAEGEFDEGLRRGEMAGDRGGDAVGEPRMALLAEAANELAGIDIDGAFGGAQAIGRTGVETVIPVFLQEGIALFAAKGRHGAADDDAAPRCEGKVAAGAFVFAVSAFDAFVDFRFNFGECLEVFDVGQFVVVYDDTGVEDILRVDDRF